MKRYLEWLKTIDNTSGILEKEINKKLLEVYEHF